MLGCPCGVAVNHEDWLYRLVPTLASCRLGIVGWECGLVRSTMLKREKFGIETIYVPVKRRGTLDPKRVEEIAESMLVNGQTTPILVRPDGARFVLVEGLHRLEAAKALGEQTIVGFRVAARKH